MPRGTVTKSPSAARNVPGLLGPRRIRMPSDDLKQRERCNVLFLCTGNSARSIMAECLLERIGATRFRAFSAGSFPAGAVNPYALEILERRNHRTDHLRSKSWDEFAAPGAPEMDFVFTVCDRAEGEVCPVWPGQPMWRALGLLPILPQVEGKEAVIRAAFANGRTVKLQRGSRCSPACRSSRSTASALKRKLGEIGASQPRPPRRRHGSGVPSSRLLPGTRPVLSFAPRVTQRHGAVEYRRPRARGPRESATK